MTSKNENIIVLRDEDGNEVEFEYLDTVEYQEQEYVVFLPVEDEEEEDGEVVILKLGEEDGDETFLPVTDQKDLDTVFELFKERMKDEFEFVD